MLTDGSRQELGLRKEEEERGQQRANQRDGSINIPSIDRTFSA